MDGAGPREDGAGPRERGAGLRGESHHSPTLSLLLPLCVLFVSHSLLPLCVFLFLSRSVSLFPSRAVFLFI